MHPKLGMRCSFPWLEVIVPTLWNRLFGTGKSAEYGLHQESRPRKAGHNRSLGFSVGFGDAEGTAQARRAATGTHTTHPQRSPGGARIGGDRLLLGP